MKGRFYRVGQRLYDHGVTKRRYWAILLGLAVKKAAVRFERVD